MTPYAAAIFMMRRGADPGLIAAYLVEEARRAGVDPAELAPKSPAELLREAARQISAAFRVAVAPAYEAVRSIERAFNTPPSGGPRRDPL